MLNFNDFYLILTPFLFLSTIWVFFFKLNSNSQKHAGNSTNTNVIKLPSNFTCISTYYYIIILNIIGNFLLHGKSSTIWFNHFNVSNFTISLLGIFLFVSFTIFLLLYISSKKANLVKSIDYIFSINNLIILLPYLFFVNTIFTFLFVLECVSVVLLYKLISSKIWFKDSLNKTKCINNNIPQNFINMVFFQYWVTFFSTIFIVYFYVNIFYIYGTSDWFIIQFLNDYDIEGQLLVNSNLKRFLVGVLLFSIFFKLGITPLHLFKVEVYKGLPFLSIFFYTTYYFIVFFIFFLFFLTDFVGCFVTQYYPILILLTITGCLYIIVLLFDVTFLKAFFTYSTILNSVGFLIAFISGL